MTHVVIGLVMVPIVWSVCVAIETFWKRWRR